MPAISFFQPQEGRAFDGPLDLNEYCVRHPAATFFVRAGSEAQREAGIRGGDLLVVDRAARPSPGAVVLIVRDGEIRMERFRAVEDGDAEIWGVVTFVIRKL